MTRAEVFRMLMGPMAGQVRQAFVEAFETGRDPRAWCLFFTDNALIAEGLGAPLRDDHHVLLSLLPKDVIQNVAAKLAPSAIAFLDQPCPDFVLPIAVYSDNELSFAQLAWNRPPKTPQ